RGRGPRAPRGCGVRGATRFRLPSYRHLPRGPSCGGSGEPSYASNPVLALAPGARGRPEARPSPGIDHRNRQRLGGGYPSRGGGHHRRGDGAHRTHRRRRPLPRRVRAGRHSPVASGEPGHDSTSIRIRGNHTLNDNGALIVIDGVPDRVGGLERLNPEDIESMSVLKDASAAIYGSRAANGVILITTKRGSGSKPELT